MFLNRQPELSYLDARYARPDAEFAVLYGRRRVGKSSLIYEWCAVSSPVTAERRHKAPSSRGVLMSRVRSRPAPVSGELPKNAESPA